MKVSPRLPISFKIQRDGSEFHAWCPELKVCHTHGKSVAEALNNLKDAVQLYLDTAIEEEIARQSVELLDEA
jgi:predicted RNase H-like HicB family nuclease